MPAPRPSRSCGTRVYRPPGPSARASRCSRLQDALATFPADRILIFVRDDADDQRYRESDVVGEAERRFDVPVTLVRL